MHFRLCILSLIVNKRNVEFVLQLLVPPSGGPGEAEGGREGGDERLILRQAGRHR